MAKKKDKDLGVSKKQDLDKIAELQNKLNEIMQKLSLLEEEHLKKDQKLTEYLDGWKRAQADLINYKREEKERLEQFKSYIGLEIIKKIVIPALDDLDRAVENIPNELSEHNWVKGLIVVSNNIVENLKSVGIVVYGQPGDNFDPNYHEVLLTEQKPEMENKIIKIVARGYKTSEGVVVRAAKVVVGKK